MMFPRVVRQGTVISKSAYILSKALLREEVFEENAPSSKDYNITTVFKRYKAFAN